MTGFWVVRATQSVWRIGNGPVIYGLPEIIGQGGKAFLEPDAKPFETRKDARLWIAACVTYGHRSEVRSTEWVMTKLVVDAVSG